MEISYVLRDAFRRFFIEKDYGTASYVGGDRSHTNIRFDTYNFYQVFLRVQNKEGIFEIPSLVRSFGAIQSFATNFVGEITVPLTVVEEQERRTSDSIFKYFFGSSRHTTLGLKKASTSKGEVYYGAPGIVLDRDFKPLIIGICEYSKDESTHGNIQRCVLKVSPKVFGSDGLLEKAVVKKLIPYYTTSNQDGRTVRVEIDDIDSYVVRPVTPKANVLQSFKDIMRTFKDEILEGII